MSLSEIMTDDLLLIVPSNLKEKVVEKVSSLSKIYSYKIVSDVQLKKTLLFDYDYHTIYYVMNTKKVTYKIAKEYIESLYYVENKQYKSQKLKELQNLKEELLSKHLLTNNEMLKKSIINYKNVAVYGFDCINKDLQKLLNQLKNYRKNDKKLLKATYTPTVYKFKEIEQEVDAICYQISDLLHGGIDINKIKIANINSDYEYILKQYFSMYNLPIDLKKKESLYSLRSIKQFYKICESKNSLQEGIECFENEHPNQSKILEKLINIANEFVNYEFNVIKDLFKGILKETTLPTNKTKDCIEIVDLENLLVEEDEFIFVLSLNQSILPKAYKDDEFLTDYEKEELDIETSYQKNEIEKEKFYLLLTKTNKLIFSYKEKSPFTNFGKSFVIEEMGITPQKYIKPNSVSYSDKVDRLTLAKAYDMVYKAKDDMFIKTLASNYDVDYGKYNHKFKKFSSELIKDYIKESKINMSYSAIKTYYECAFKYYLKNILKLEERKDIISEQIGTAFHKILELSYSSNFDFEKEHQKQLESIDDVTTKFYVKKLKNTLKDIIEINKSMFKDTQLTDVLTEKKIEIDIKEYDIVFKGFIDKILYKSENGKTYVSIIDYKTNSPEFDLEGIEHGLFLQLPIYLYLIKKGNLFDNVEFCGFYIQTLLPKTIKIEEGYEKTLKNTLLLNGYSNSSFNTLSLFDPHYENSSLIKSMKVNKNGEFNAHAKTMDNDKMNEIADTVETIVKQAIENINNCDFDINPKLYKNNNVSCEYCPFNDCCFKEYGDNVYLKNKVIQKVGE